MTSQQMDKILEAMEAAGITYYSVGSDMPSYFYNDEEHHIIIPDNSLDCIHAFRKNGFGGAHSYLPDKMKVTYACVDYADIHEVKVGGSADQMITFADSLGLNLTDDQKNILRWIDKSTSDLKPITGDYTFKPISEEEYEALTEEEKEIYDKKLKQYNLEKAGISGKASISVQM